MMKTKFEAAGFKEWVYLYLGNNKTIFRGCTWLVTSVGNFRCVFLTWYHSFINKYIWTYYLTNIKSALL